MTIVTTNRLSLRPFTVDDADAMQRVLCDPEVMRYSTGVKRPDEVGTWLRERANRDVSRGYALWAVVEKTSDAVIGYCGLSHWPDVNGREEVEIGYRLARMHWGRGCATEAATAVRDVAFNVLHLPRLIALIDPANGASIRVAERLGMQHESEIIFDGYTHADRVYAVARR